MQSEIFAILKNNYKRSQASYVHVHGEWVTIIDMGLDYRLMPFAAKRILAKYPELHTVHFTGHFIEHVYTRETLKWLAIR